VNESTRRALRDEQADRDTVAWCDHCDQPELNCQCAVCVECGDLITDTLNVSDVCDACAQHILREVELKHARQAIALGLTIYILIVLAYAAWHFS
jgi:hypothetical protein